MKSIANIFDNGKELFDSITNFVDKYIGASLLRRCNITKTVDGITENTAYEYVDNRYYHVQQYDTFLTITQLRTLGMSLAEIKNT